MDFATFGSLGIDDLVFADGATMWCVPGGGAMYAALGMAIWGALPGVVAPVAGDYPFNLFDARLDFSHAPRIGSTMRNWGLYEQDGSRRFVLRSVERSYRGYCVRPEAVGGEQFTHVHISAMPWDMQRDVALELRKKGTRTLSIDADDQYAERMTPEDMAEIMSLSDLFQPSWQDVRNMLPGRSPFQSLRELRAICSDLPVLVIKMGAEGVFVHAAGDDHVAIVPSAATDVIDVTGAGDAFAGGSLQGYAETRDPIEAAVRGTVSASFALASHGPGAMLAAQPEDALRRAAALRGQITTKPFHST